MRVTRRFWTVAAVGAFLAAWGVVLADPLPVVGASGVAAWVVVRQYRFVGRSVATADALAVGLDLDRERVPAGETTQVVATARVEPAAGVAVDLAVEPPVAADGRAAVASVAPGERSAVAETELTWPVGGSYAFDRPSATFRDPAGLFEESRPVGEGPQVVVDPPAPRNVHVGVGGDPVAAAFGEREVGRLDTGIEPANIREYNPGDDVNVIDWKATARTDEVHVREFESGTSQGTILVVDHRAGTDTGPDGRTQLDYARHVALALVGGARKRGDRVGLYAVGDRGLTAAVEPGTTDRHYRAVRQRLVDLAPTAAAPDGEWPAGGTAALADEYLDGADGAFARTLGRYVDDRRPTVGRVEDLPLATGVEAAQRRREGTGRTVIVTDDADRTELRKAVRVARRGEGRVEVFLTPDVLFERTEPASPTEARDRYAAFESFRSDLAALDGVAAYEVGPGDRLEAVLAGAGDGRGVA